MVRDFIYQQLVNAGCIDQYANELAKMAVLAFIGLASLLLFWVLRKFLLKTIHRFVEKTSNRWDDALLDTGVIRRFLRLIPLTMMLLCIDRFLAGEFLLFRRFLFSILLFSVARTLAAFLEAFSDIYHRSGSGQRKPIRPLFQALTIVDYLLATIFCIGVLLDKSPWGLFSLLGGLTAVTMLVFKDTILGFVAGIQLGANDMVREGDWIEMAKYGADGDVIEVAVNTVKVRNWDKTISTIPTYALISDSFKNWRGMSESGGRRIKRSINIDMNTVRFADEAMLEHFRKMDLLKEYVESRQQEIDQYNHDIDLSATTVNGRRQTNLGIFRAYLQSYLRQHPKIHDEMTFLVRHLAPTETGLPIEIYVFSNDQVWANYEAIQADIFDHIIAAIPEFYLRIFQQPSGNDFASLLGHSV